MDDFDVGCDLNDEEMLDDASEEASYPSPASPLQVAHVDNGDTQPGNPHRTQPAISVNNRDKRELSTALDRLCSEEHRPTSPHADSPARPARTSQQDVSKSEVEKRSNVLAKIESVFEGMLDVLLNERGQLSVAIKTRPLSRGQLRDFINASQTHAESVQHLCFPGKTEKEAWRFGERGMRSSFWRQDTDAAQL